MKQAFRRLMDIFFAFVFGCILFTLLMWTVIGFLVLINGTSLWFVIPMCVLCTMMVLYWNRLR